MKKTLRERYDERKRDEQLTEGFLDYFQKGSTNIQTFNNTIAQLKNLSNKYQLKTLQGAVATAEKQFSDVVMAQQQGQKPDANKSTMISKATAFVAGMSSFLQSLKTITTQLPAMKDALAKANTPEGEKRVSELLGNDAQQFGQLITAQLQKSGGGILSKIKGFFTGSGTQTPAQVMAEFGLPPEALAQDILNLTAKQMTQFVGESASVKPFELQQQPGADQQRQGNTGTRGAEATAQAQGTQQTVQGGQPTAETVPTTKTVQGGPNQRPSESQAKERDISIQHAVPQTARNAFNSQMLGKLSNEEISQAFKAIAQQLGLKL